MWLAVQDAGLFSMPLPLSRGFPAVTLNVFAGGPKSILLIDVLSM